jgi:hypothetical protein
MPRLSHSLPITSPTRTAPIKIDIGLVRIPSNAPRRESWPVTQHGYDAPVGGLDHYIDSRLPSGRFRID